MTDAQRSVDFIARLAEAWDGKGRHIFLAPFEHQMLAVRAGLRPEVANVSWRNLHSNERRALLAAARLGVNFGRACAWVFGEGNGA